MALLKYTVVVLLTAIALQLLPNFSPKLAVNMGGRVEPGFERVAQIFREQMEKQPDQGRAFSAYYKGRPVVDLWGGYANPDIERPWNEDTMSIYYSATKGVAAICIAMQVDRGLLDYDKPVSKYWPEFAQNGKDKITVKHLVGHQAALPLIATPINITVMRDHKELGKVLAKEKPMWEPGKKVYYHALTYGLYLSQLISHVDPKGRTVGQFFKEELRDKYDIDFFIGVPLRESYRVAHDYPISALQQIAKCITELNWGYTKFLFGSLLFPDGISGRYFENPSDFNQIHRWNIPEYQQIEQAAAMGIGTARSMAKFYGILANGGKDGERQLLSPKRIEQFYNADVKRVKTGIGMLQNRGWILGLLSGSNPEVILDMNADSERPDAGPAVVWHQHRAGDLSPEGQATFGHPGMGGQVTLADPHKRLGFGYLRNSHGIYGDDDPFFLALKNAVYDSVKQLK